MEKFEFACPSCQELLAAPLSASALMTPCPACQKILHVPATLPAQGQEQTVGVNLTMPKGLGGFQTKVSQSTANHMASTWLGGLLVVVGVVIAAMFGVNLRGRGGA